MLHDCCKAGSRTACAISDVAQLHHDTKAMLVPVKDPGSDLYTVGCNANHHYKLLLLLPALLCAVRCDQHRFQCMQVLPTSFLFISLFTVIIQPLQ
jgi:hypothetical protein